MKPRYLVATLLAALLGACAAVLLSAGLGDAPWLAETPVGRWLDLRAPSIAPPNAVTPAIAGQMIGSLPLTDLDGQPQALPSGRRVLANVWASWCAPCREEIPLLDAFARAQGADGVAVVGIAEDDAASTRRFLHSAPMSYPVLLDDGQWRAGTRLGNRLGVLPFSALLDADGRLLRVHAGAFPDRKALQHWIDSGN